VNEDEIVPLVEFARRNGPPFKIDLQNGN
jgi:hypothetical protein